MFLLGLAQENEDREFKVKLTANDEETETLMVLRGGKEDVERMEREMALQQQGMVRVKGVFGDMAQPGLADGLASRKGLRGPERQDASLCFIRAPPRRLIHREGGHGPPRGASEGATCGATHGARSCRPVSGCIPPPTRRATPLLLERSTARGVICGAGRPRRWAFIRDILLSDYFRRPASRTSRRDGIVLRAQHEQVVVRFRA